MSDLRAFIDAAAAAGFRCRELPKSNADPTTALRMYTIAVDSSRKDRCIVFYTDDCRIMQCAMAKQLDQQKFTVDEMVYKIARQWEEYAFVGIFHGSQYLVRRNGDISRFTRMFQKWPVGSPETYKCVICLQESANITRGAACGICCEYMCATCFGQYMGTGQIRCRVCRS
jgi:hypothetical protein